MHAHAGRLPWYAAGLAAMLAAALAGCGSSPSSTSTSAFSSAAAAPPASALAAVKLAAQTANGANSYTGTMTLRATAKGGTAGSAETSMSASFAERVRPSLLARAEIASLDAGGSSLPGGLTEIITPGTFYMKWPFLTRALHLTKPWLAVPVATLNSRSGVNFSQIFTQAQSGGPLTQSAMLAGAANVRKAGTGTVDGVPVTEYTGTLSIARGLRHLSGSTKSAVQKELTAAGITTARFTVWIDAQHTVRKAVITEDGSSMTETIITTITSINQPVNVQVPAASQTAPLPGGALGSLG